MQSRSMIASTLMLLSSAAAAAPTVTGNVISWPDDGWYQVQQVTQNGIVEVCREGLSCEVNPGEYIVINHTTNERFEGIVIAPPTRPDRITVSGNVISWPSNGWYQVLDEADYSEVCGGTSSCEVPPGSYLVINHTNGQRVSHVLIGESNAPDSVVVVTGNTISWPDDGWYQVQRTDTYESICNGGSSCEVPNGKYKVINHTTGEQFGNIIVNAAIIDPVDPIDPIDPSDFDLLNASRGLIADLAGYQLDQLAVVVDDLAYVVEQETTITWPDSDYYQVQKAPSFATGSPVYESICNGEPVCQVVPGTYTVINQTTGERSSLEVPYIEPANLPDSTLLAASSFTYEDIDPFYATETFEIERREYNCEGGGSLVRETGFAGLKNQDGTSTPAGVTRDGYLFDQCRMSLTGGLLPNDSYLIQGNLFTVSAGNGYDDSKSYSYDSLSINADSGLEYRVDGDVEDFDGIENTSAGALALSYRDATITQYQKISSDGQSIASITDGQLAYKYGPEFLLDVSGVVRNEQTANQSVAFSTDSSLSGYFLFTDPDSATPFTGSINLLADDGSFLGITAQGTETDAFAIINDYTTADGESIQEPGPTFNYFAQDFNCQFERDSVTQRLACTGSQVGAEGAAFVIP